MKYKSNPNKAFTTLLIVNLILAFILNFSFITYAYIAQQIEQRATNRLNINILFGVLDDSVNPGGDWGSEANPYLISEPRHLQNLVVIQNRANQTIITKDSVFQVSDSFGNPIYIGGASTSSLLALSSIGTEDYPFISSFRGVTTTDTNAYVTLPTGEKSDTSVLGNIQINATQTQTDIGLFGNVGPKTKPADEVPVGEISNLLVYNVNITSSSIGGTGPDHDNFVTSAPYESNHIGILVGHAQYTSINNISVYYSGANGNPTVKAFNIHSIAGNSSVPKYTTASGIIGYYRDLTLGDEDLPVTSDGSQDVFGNVSGLGLGVVFSNDIWKFMEDQSGVGSPAPNDEYGLQETFGPELYGQGNTAEKYFQIGVFTFGHSMQTTKDDSIAKLWANEPNEWQVSTSGTYSHASVNQNVVTKSYSLTQITNSQMRNLTTSSSYHQLNATLSTTAYRYMITIDNGGKTYALIRNGATAVPKEIIINTSGGNNFAIPESELQYYTFAPHFGVQADSTVPPYGSYGVRLTNPYSNPLNFNQRNATTNNPQQLLGYGYDITRNSVKKEIPRPLRVYYTGGAGTASFMASSTGTSNPEGIRFLPLNTAGNYINVTSSGSTPNSTTYNTFMLQRRWGSTSNNSYLSFTSTGGFSSVTATSPTNAASTSGIAKVRLWAVNITNPSNSNYVKSIYTPTSNLKTYDMRENVLYYTGTPNSTNNSLRYQYEYRSLESLEWPDNTGSPITTLDHAIKMAAPTSYYFLNNRFWGVIEDIPNPGGSGTINVPEGSIGFTVQGGPSGTPNATVQVIVATEPSQDLNQTITMSRFGTGTSQTGDRYEIANGTLPLPPVPGPNAATTVPIRVIDNGNTYNNLYPNQNVLLVAYEFSVPVLTQSITYFLEASQGNANFVYLSSGRSSAKDNNPFHENDARMKQLDSVDFVHKTSSNVIATVTHPDYRRSLTAPYFGITRNPNNLDGDIPELDALIISITTTYDFTYAINRAYNANDEKYYIYITIVVSAPSNVTGNSDAIIKTIMDNHNFNFGEWSYLNSDNFEFVYSDVVVISINSKTVDWTKL